MAAWTSEDVTALCPELVTSPVIAPSVFTRFIGIAERQVSPEAFGDRIVEAGAYLTAHLMLRSGYGVNAAGAGGAGMAAGNVTGISVGKVSVSFGSLASAAGGGVSAEDAELMTTRPGSLFLAQARLCVATPIVLMGEIPGVL